MASRLTKNVLKDRYKGYTVVERCRTNENSWCCAGVAGDNCCSTNLTTSLEPYPPSTIKTTITSLLSTATLSISSSFNPISFQAPTTSQNSVMLLTSSRSPQPAISPQPATSPQPASHNHNPTTEIAIGVPMAVVIVFLAILLFLFWKKNIQKQNFTDLKRERTENPLSFRPELLGFDENPVYELDVSRYELSHANAPRHELSWQYGRAFPIIHITLCLFREKVFWGSNATFKAARNPWSTWPSEGKTQLKAAVNTSLFGCHRGILIVSPWSDLEIARYHHAFMPRH